jgi:hypothetical protein
MVWPLVSLVLGNNQGGSLLACGSNHLNPHCFSTSNNSCQRPPKLSLTRDSSLPHGYKIWFSIYFKMTLDGLLELISDFQGTIKWFKTDIQSWIKRIPYHSKHIYSLSYKGDESSFYKTSAFSIKNDWPPISKPWLVHFWHIINWIKELFKT